MPDKTQKTLKSGEGLAEIRDHMTETEEYRLRWIFYVFNTKNMKFYVSSHWGYKYNENSKIWQNLSARKSFKKIILNRNKPLTSQKVF